MRITFCQFSLISGIPFDLTQVAERFKINPQKRLKSIHGIRYFHKPHVDENVLFEYQVVGDSVVYRKYYPHEPGMIHIKCTFHKKLVEIKMFPSGKIMVTCAYPESIDSTRTAFVEYIDKVQDYIEQVSNRFQMKRSVNLIRADLSSFQDGSFDRDLLKEVLVPEFGFVRDTDTVAERVQAVDGENPNFSVLFQRKGKVQVIMSYKSLGDESGPEKAFQFITKVEQLIRMIKARSNKNNVYIPDVTNLSECNGNPVPSPRSFTGTCPAEYFVIPSKKGAPCCKKIPDYAKSSLFWKGVSKKYATFGVPIPDSLYLLTGRSKGSPARPLNVPGPSNPPPAHKTFTVMGDGEMRQRGKQQVYADFYVNGKECYKLPVKDIKQIGAYLGIDIKHLRTGGKICQAIDELSRKNYPYLIRSDRPPRTSPPKKRMVEIVNTGKQTRNMIKEKFDKFKCGKGTKKRGFYSIPEIKGMASILGIRGYSKMKKEDLCKKIEESITAL